MTLSQIRNQINEIDDKILQLILERIKCSESIAKIKSNENIPITDKTRESEILNNIKIKSEDKFKYTLPIFEEILDVSRNIQNELINNKFK